MSCAYLLPAREEIAAVHGIKCSYDQHIHGALTLTYPQLENYLKQVAQAWTSKKEA